MLARPFILPNYAISRLLDDFDNAACTRVDQNRTIVHDRITVAGRDVVFRRHVVVANALFRENGADGNRLAVP